MERAFRPLWEEAPVDASEHPLVRELVSSVPESDGRQADVFVRGMAIGNGLPVVGDMCMGSVLHANGTPYTDAATVDGQAIERLTDQEHDKFPEVIAADQIPYVVLVCKEGSCWGTDVLTVGNELVRLKVAPLRPLLRKSAAFAEMVW